MVPCVLHCDVDAFFCQVEVLRNPSLAGLPLAVQQHQDVIAVNYAARQAGVKKHMAPAQARQLLAPVGGRLVHVFCEEGLRVSYRPYREASAAFSKLLRRFVNAAVVERASIDEAYILCAPPGTTLQAPQQPPPQPPPPAAAAGDAGGGPGSRGAPGPAGVLAGEVPEGGVWDLSLGARLAGSIREACVAELGLQVSVGVAPNKLLAKLASRAAKPDGLLLLGSTHSVQQLLQRTPVDKLPGMGGQVAALLLKAGAHRVSDLQSWPWPHLLGVVGGQHKLAARLWEWCWGRDPAPVADKGPPKSIQVQMSLTPQLMPLPPSVANRAAVGQPPAATAAGGSSSGPQPQQMVLQPLSCGSPDTLLRLRQVMGAMLGDLLSRVLLDRHTSDRWPRKLALTLATSGPGGRSGSRSCAFPTPALIAAGDVVGGGITLQAPAAAAGAAAAGAASAGGVGSTRHAGAGSTGAGKVGGSAATTGRIAAADAAAAGGSTGMDAGAAAGASGATGSGGPAAPGSSAAGPTSAAVVLPGTEAVGERRYAVDQQLQQAVLGLLAGLAQALVAGLGPATAVSQLNISVSSFTSYEAAASGSIRSFFNPVKPQRPAAPTDGTVAAAATTRGTVVGAAAAEGAAAAHQETVGPALQSTVEAAAPQQGPGAAAAAAIWGPMAAAATRQIPTAPEEGADDDAAAAVAAAGGGVGGVGATAAGVGGGGVIAAGGAGPSSAAAAASMQQQLQPRQHPLQQQQQHVGVQVVDGLPELVAAAAAAAARGGTAAAALHQDVCEVNEDVDMEDVQEAVAAHHLSERQQQQPPQHQQQVLPLKGTVGSRNQLVGHTLPQPLVRKRQQQEAVGGVVGQPVSAAAARLQLSSMLLQLADPEYLVEVAQQDFTAWDAAWQASWAGRT